MSAKKRMQSAREMKDKRTKRVAIGGAVLLVAVLAFEVPKVMKHGGSGSRLLRPRRPPRTADTGVSTPAATPAGTAAAAVTPTASTKLPNSDVVPRRAKSQLLLLQPLRRQGPVRAAGVDAAGAADQSAAPGAGPDARRDHGREREKLRRARQSSSGRQSRTLAVTGAVKITVNGRPETVRVGASFPSENPLFKLVSVSPRRGRGSGSRTAPTRAARIPSPSSRPDSLTLVDTADGIHYRIRLLSVA